MKNLLTFALLMIFTAIFTTTFVLAQSRLISRIHLPNDELKGNHFQTFNKNDDLTNFEKFFLQNTKSQQNTSGRIFRNNPLKSQKNSDEIVYDYDSIQTDSKRC